MSWFIENFKKFDDKKAIVFDDKVFTYKQLYEHIKYIEKNVIQEISKGEVVAILSDYSFESIALFLALYENKNIVVPITSKATNEIEEKIKESFSDKKIFILNDKYKIEKISSNQKHQMIKNLQENNQAGLILFSSGSTGKPKAMIHNLDNLVNHYKNKKRKNYKHDTFFNV